MKKADKDFAPINAGESFSPRHIDENGNTLTGTNHTDSRDNVPERVSDCCGAEMHFARCGYLKIGGNYTCKKCDKICTPVPASEDEHIKELAVGPKVPASETESQPESVFEKKCSCGKPVSWEHGSSNFCHEFPMCQEQPQDKAGEIMVSNCHGAKIFAAGPEKDLYCSECKEGCTPKEPEDKAGEDVTLVYMHRECQNGSGYDSNSGMNDTGGYHWKRECKHFETRAEALAFIEKWDDTFWYRDFQIMVPESYAQEAIRRDRQERGDTIKRLTFMIDNGLGWDDMKNDI